MCDMVTGGKGSSIRVSLVDSGEGDLSKRSASAIGISRETRVICGENCSHTSTEMRYFEVHL